MPYIRSHDCSCSLEKKASSNQYIQHSSQGKHAAKSEEFHAPCELRRNE